MKRIAYIPARGGSKGVPGKNIRNLCGKPLISYTITAARLYGLFDRIFVSTDSAEIAEIARQYGAWVPFLRDASVAGDQTPTIDAVCSDKDKLRMLGFDFDTFCLLQPTSPLRTARHIAEAVEKSERSGMTVLSVVPVAEHPALMKYMDVGTGALTPVLSVAPHLRRQDMPPVYRVNGAIYVSRWSELSPAFDFAANATGYVMDIQSSVDIDTIHDFEKVEQILVERWR